MHLFRIFAAILILTAMPLLTGCPATQTGTSNSGPFPNEGASGENQTEEEIIPELVSELDLDMSDLDRISGNLGVEVASGQNLFYMVDGTEVRVNFLVPQRERDLIPLFENLFTMVGAANSILAGEDRVYELIGDDPWAVEQVRDILDLAPLQDVKFTAHSIYGEGRMVADELIDRNDTDNIAARLGVSIEKLINQRVIIEGTEVQVNFLLPGGTDTALEVFGALSDFKGTEEGLYILDDIVIEVVTDNHEIAERIWRILNTEPLSPSRICRFEVRVEVIPISRANYMELNDLSIQAVQGASVEELQEQDPSLELGDTLPLFLNRGFTRIETVPEIETEMIDDSLGIGHVPASMISEGHSAVDVTMIVETGHQNNSGPENLSPYLAATDFWPVGDEEIETVLDEALGGHRRGTSREKTEAIWSWVRDNIDYSGDRMGTRYGPLRVIEQGYGRCWDHSDVFITLARTAGIPSRQVNGWLYGVDGHVWSQVWLEDEEIWLDVDTTAEGLGVDSFYVPMWGTRDGDMLVLYREWPKVERLPTS